MAAPAVSHPLPFGYQGLVLNASDTDALLTPGGLYRCKGSSGFSAVITSDNNRVSSPRCRPARDYVTIPCHVPTATPLSARIPPGHPLRHREGPKGWARDLGLLP